MDKAYFQRMFDYNAWENRRVWECVEELSDDAFEQDLDYSIGSIRTQCLHTLYMEHWWFQYLLTGRPNIPKPQELPSRKNIRALWEKVEAVSIAYLERLTPAELQREIVPLLWGEDAKPIKVWEALIQVVNHSTDHRAQTLAMLHQLGMSTVAQDFLDFAGEQQDETEHLCLFMIG